MSKESTTDRAKSKKRKKDANEGGFFRRIVRKYWKRMLIMLIALVTILGIINISSRIAPNRRELLVPDVIGFDSVHITLMLLSGFLILMTFSVFTRIIFRDYKDDFGIVSIYSPKAIVFRILILLFISSVFILLDVALVNIYITLPAVTLAWLVSNAYGLNWGTGTDLFTYANVRSNLFYISFIVVLAFPALMFFLILTRYGRKKLIDIPNIHMKAYRRAFKFFGAVNFIISALVFTYLFLLGYVTIYDSIPIMVIMMFFLQTIFLFILISIEILRRLFHLSSSYLLMVIPIVLIFYVTPVLLWAFWDTILVNVGGDLSKTIFGTAPTETGFPLFIKSLRLNSADIRRILELDFVIMIGVAAIVIGFAEGYSLFSIVRSISQGQKITRAGKLVSSSSSAGVRVTQSFFLATWFSMLWDKMIQSLSFFVLDFGLPLDFVLRLPSIIKISLDFSLLIDQQFFLPLTFLILPALIIVNSLFKFLSVSIITQYTKEDYQIFFLLISSTFVLIIIKIYSDIASIAPLQGEFIQLIPFSSFSESNLLIFSVKVFSNLEAFAFFAGLFTVVYRAIFKRSKSDEKS